MGLASRRQGGGGGADLCEDDESEAGRGARNPTRSLDEPLEHAGDHHPVAHLTLISVIDSVWLLIGRHEARGSRPRCRRRRQRVIRGAWCPIVRVRVRVRVTVLTFLRVARKCFR